MAVLPGQLAWLSHVFRGLGLLELDRELWDERLGLDADSADSINTVRARFATFISDEQEEVSLLSLSQCVGFNKTWARFSFLGVVVEHNLESVCAGKSDQFEGCTGLPGGHVPGRTPIRDEVTSRNRCQG